MSKNRKRPYTPQAKLELGGYDQVIKKLEIEKALAIQEAFDSRDPQAIMKAQVYLENQKSKVQQGVTRAFQFDPNNAQFTGQGYKREVKKVSFDVLKKMGQLHIAKMVKKTRIDQVKNFLNFTIDKQKEGFTIRRRKGLFDDDKELNAADKKEVEKIVRFLENSKLPVEKKSGVIAFDLDLKGPVAFNWTSPFSKLTKTYI